MGSSCELIAEVLLVDEMCGVEVAVVDLVSVPESVEVLFWLDAAGAGATNRLGSAD